MIQQVASSAEQAEGRHQASSPPSHPVLLFDGVCNLCNGAVQFIIRRDGAARVHFASLQSKAGQQMVEQSKLEALGSGPAGLGSVVLIDQGRIYTESAAVLRVSRYLRWPWPLLRGLVVVPSPLRNAVYRLVARNRYRWFGKREACMLPSPAVSGRFLDSDESLD